MGFNPETIQSLMRLVTAILFAGNMSFTPSEDGESCKLDKTKSALACAALLGISFDGLAKALTAKSIVAANESVEKLLTIEESGKACEALIKAVYGAAFDFIVAYWISLALKHLKSIALSKFASITPMKHCNSSSIDMYSSWNNKNMKRKGSCGSLLNFRIIRMCWI
jgi:myosin heavy subunit